MRPFIALAAAAWLAGCATPPAPASLTGPAWTIESIAGEVPAGGRPATLQFSAAGRLAGQGPCNRYGGSWRQEGDELQVRALFATRMACPEPAMAQEAVFLRALEAGRAELRGAGRLEITGRDGARIVARR